MPSGNKTLEFKIWATNHVRRGAQAAKREMAGLKRVAKSLTAVGRGLGRAWKGVRSTFLKVAAGFAIVAGALAITLKKAFMFERFTIQFKVLFRDMDRAKAHMKSLAEFSAKTPFQIGDLAKASRQLIVFTDDVMSTTAALTLVGDAAAATGNDISAVALWTARAYSLIKGGQPFGEAALRLQEMALLSSKARAEMERLIKAGAPVGQVWAILSGELDRFTGGMQEAAMTGEGLTSTLRDNLGLALAEFGNVFMEDAKGGIQGLIEWLQKLKNDGTIKAWAEQARELIGLTAEVAKAISGASGDDKRTKAMEGIVEMIAGAFQWGAGLAVDVLIKAAPLIGGLLGAAAAKLAMSPIKNAAERSIASEQVLDEMKAEEAAGQKKHKGAFGSMIGTTEYKQRVEARRKEIHNTMLREKGESAVVGDTWTERGKSRVENAKVKLGSLGLTDEQKAARNAHAGATEAARATRMKAIGEAKKEVKAADPKDQGNLMKAFQELIHKMDASGAGPKSGTYQDIFDDYKEARAGKARQRKKEQEDMAATELVNAGLRKEESAKLFKEGNGKEAYKRAREKLGHDPKSSVDWLTITKAMKKALVKIASEKEAETERVKTKTESLAERKRRFAVSLMSPENQKKATEKNIADLKDQRAKATDPETKIDLGTKIQDEMERLQGIQGKNARKTIGLGEIFTRIHGQGQGSKDPAIQQVDLLREVKGILKSIEGKGGMNP